MIDRKQLLKDLQRELPKIEKDILAYSESKPELTEHLQSEYKKAQEAGRTADHFVAWREAQITQAAVAWVLTCVFVRFLEDNGLLKEPVLSGPVENEQGGNPLQHAKERMVAYFNQNPTHAEREYLLSLFEELEAFPVIAELLDHKHNPLWQIPISADGAKQLIDFFQKIDVESGEVVHDYTDEDWDTRFLGDLYQDLSESVRKKYALLQTPEFVESFILDYTLEKAKETFGLEGLRLIDPTCGSGHFLLTTFELCFDDWVRKEPSTNSRELAQRALDVVHGVDVNPYAIAVCRFRLLISAMKACGSNKVKDAPNFKFNLACGDSLLHGKRFDWQGQGIQNTLIDEDPIKHVLEVEDREKLERILGQQYHAVVGNPPYITVKDSSVRESIRTRYLTCHAKYSLGVPFTERFFELCVSDEDGPGYMGMITTNSFMKRGFGKKLIEDYFPRKKLTHIIDTSGAYIPGHGTPTVILFGRNVKPSVNPIKVALGKRAEPITPDEPSEGLVWKSISENIQKNQFENEFIQIEEKERSHYRKHPWSLTGGGAVELKQYIDSYNLSTLKSITSSIGPTSFPGLDDTFVFKKNTLQRFVDDSNLIKPFVFGESLRDWLFDDDLEALVPYDENYEPLDYDGTKRWGRFLWPYKTNLQGLVSFGGKTRKDLGEDWWTWYRWIKDRFSQPLSIAYAEVASHNYFVFFDGGVVYKQTAPTIKLENEATLEGYITLTAYLNSSLVCFLMKQVSHQKQMTGGDGVRVESISKVPYQYAGTALGGLPVPTELLKESSFVGLSRRLYDVYTELKSSSLTLQLEECLENNTNIDEVYNSYTKKKLILKNELIFLQEELDWVVYSFFNLCDSECLSSGSIIQSGQIEAGERPFELKRQENQDGFVVPKDIPRRCSGGLKELWEKRISLINDNKNISVLEDPHYKRRWIGRQGLFNKSANKNEIKECCQKWLLRFIERKFSVLACEFITCSILADKVSCEKDFIRVASLYSGQEQFDVQKLVENLVKDKHVPLSSSLRFKPKAKSKVIAWQEVWDKQRTEDKIEQEFRLDDKDDPSFLKRLEQANQKKGDLVGDIPIPPKFISSDYIKPSYWTLRGKLDISTEAFVSLPGCEKNGDSTLVIGWAGMNYLQRAQASASWYLGRKESDGWEAEKLMPLLVSLDELIPWLKQWHNDIDPEFGERMGDYYEGFLLEEMRQLEVTKADLLAWEPPATTRTRRRA